MINPSFLVTGIVLFLRILSFLIVVRVLLSWFIPQARNVLVLFIYDTSDFVLRPIRHLIRPTGGIDWTPFIAIILIDVLRNVIIRIFP